MLADSRRYFQREGLEIKWADVTPERSVNKGEMYIDILERGTADLYHAADWVCVDRTSNSAKGWMVAKSPARPGTLNSSFTLFSGSKSRIASPQDLADQPIAVDLGTGSYYTVMQDLEQCIPRAKINLVQIGEPNQRLVALLDGRVSGASLLSPWSDIAGALGMREVLKTNRKGSTVVVARRDLSPDTQRQFFRGLNSAIKLIDDDPDGCRNEYFGKIEDILATMPSEVTKAAESLKETIPIPGWAPWEEFTEKDFQLAYTWMLDRGLAKPGLRFSDVAYPDSSGLF
jgi:ABC-type nitrate/sulfonate/bicarbonate transport system substrate-binding protein